MNPAQQEELRSRLLTLLDKRYEEKFYDSLGADALCERLSITLQELEVLIAPLLAQEWIEKEGEMLGGHFFLSLTTLGKEHLDKAMGNAANEQIRESLLEHLNTKYSQDVHAIVNASELADLVGTATTNQVDFNLKIMEEIGHVRIYKGGPPYDVSLTPEGKTAYDNPEPRILFLSHAATDEEIAKYLKQAIEGSFSRIDVFVSSDPEDLPPGNRWVETVLENLAASRMVLVLATARGLGRKWVWFETGAGWSRNLPIIPCCLGSVRKGQLQQPFSDYQALNVDEEDDFRILVDILSKQFSASSQTPDIPTVVSNLIRLDVRAEERARINETAPYAVEMKAQVDEGLNRLNEGEKEAIRILFREGQVTDSRAIQLVRQKGLLKDNPTNIFTQINSETGFVQRVWPLNEIEFGVGYQGPWIINEHLKPLLREYLFLRKSK